MHNANTRTSRPPNKNTICSNAPSLNNSPKAAFEMRINSNSCGIITGNPIITMMAAFWFARDAIAASSVNTRLMLTPPKIVMPVNCSACKKGTPRKKLNVSKLSKLITSISITLYSSLARINSCGLTME